ncbi:MAG: oxygenase MpaB family protein [Pyrinomonadaceae bacterium]
MGRKHITERIARLDAEKDHQEIFFLLNCHVFPWDIERALEFALFRTYAVPSISKLLSQTGEFTRRPQKRYDDTELIMYTITENGYDSPEARRAFRRMNQMHGRFPISNADLLYVLTTFIFEPIRWIEKYGWRPLAENEKLSYFYFYREVGKRMNIRDIPDDFEEIEDYNRNYERDNFRHADTNREIGDVTLDLMLGFYLPKFLFPIARPLVYALMDEPLLKAFDYPMPNGFMRAVAGGLLKLRGRILRLFPERKKPLLGSKRRRPTYPEGYEIEELGTFRK